MKQLSLLAASTRILTLITAVILLLMPFHAVLTIGLSQAVDNYTALRLWKEVLLVIAMIAAGFVLLKNKALRDELTGSMLGRAVVVFMLLTVIWTLAGLVINDTTPKAAGYGLITDSRFAIFMIIALVAARSSQWLWRKRYLIALGPAGIVVLFGLLQQYVLPADVLKHLGYNEQTIRPFQRIDKKDEYVRIISTLRGANPLGAYLVFVGSLVAILFRRKTLIIAIGMAAIVSVLFASQSRSAWLGLIVAIAVPIAMRLGKKALHPILLVTTVFLITATALVYIHRDNDFVQNTVFHTDETSLAANSSNDDRLGALQSGTRDIVNQPMGQGVGTAGPASVYNQPQPGRLAENYYLQIGQEMGWIGLASFLLLQVIVAVELWRRRGDLFAAGLLAALIGLTIVNMLSHAWADDTLAYVFWGLVGIALSKGSLLMRRPIHAPKNS